MRFLVDAQLPPALARLLHAQGHEASHAVDLNLEQASDRTIWAHAQANRCVIVTKDEDFVTLRTVAAEGPAVVWVRLGNTTRRQLLDWFLPQLPAIVAALEQGDTLVEMS